MMAAERQKQGQHAQERGTREGSMCRREASERVRRLLEKQEASEAARKRQKVHRQIGCISCRMG